MGRLERVRHTLGWLRLLAEPVAKEAEFSRWINAHNTDTNQADDWCTRCAEVEVTRLNAENPDGEFFVDGGWGSPADTPPYCCKCGKTLNDHLTLYGIYYELSHYAHHHVVATPEAAFGFCQILESGSFDERDPDIWRFFLRLERMQVRRAAAQAKGGEQ